MLEKTYQPAEIEPRITEQWDTAEAFRSGRAERAGAAPYSIVIPPPNVTGSLHMGHALNNTLQDVLVRFERMRGRDVLWQPGTDHAGIATQMVVERKLAADGKADRRRMGRAAFVDEVWRWKEESGSTILNQLRRLGASCDWSRERFTMDEGLSRAVVRVFVKLYRDGLIYKDKRLVNWDPKFQTAISDLEVVQVEAKGTLTWTDGDPEVPFDPAALAKALKKDPSGHMYHFRYPLADGASYEHPVAFDADGKPTSFETRDYITVATTRPETMLGDSGVAVHPGDERYAALVKAGAKVVLPLVGREIPIVADDYSDPEKGTGAVKITPAHDFNDFEVGRRHNLEKINVLDAYGKLTDDVPEGYRGGDRFVVRQEIVGDMAALGLLAKIEPTTHTVPHGDRSGVVIEPWLTDQWYVNAEALAKPAIAAVEAGQTKFVPETWDKTYFEWMRNIQPWCISRQLWWGHQIPAWYGEDGEVFVAHDEAEARALAEKHYATSPPPSWGRSGGGEPRTSDGGSPPTPGPSPQGGGEIVITRDEDVLDTWFSSALWPFSTLGWPDETKELARYYPTSVLVTGFDIIFFWVARMMMMGLHFMKEIPFHHVYIHALVRDERGQKMSKSKGNVIDPLHLIDKYGADALRFTLSAMAAQGRDIKLAASRVEGYRNFATKLWNAARFGEMNECVRQFDFDPTRVEHTLNRWIVGETERAAGAVTEGLEAYKFNEAAGAIYEFVWGVYCDWYLELIKPILAGDDEEAKAETRNCAAWVLDQCLKLLHPFMPFITEELWAHMVEHGEQRRSLLSLAEWPKLSGLQSPEADAEIGWVVKIVSEVRSVRTEMNVPAGAKVPLILSGASASTVERARRHEDTISRLARLESISFGETIPKGAALVVIDEATAALPLEGVIDTEAERKRLKKEIEKAEGDLGKAQGWLANEANVARSPAHVVELNRERVAENEGRIARLAAALKMIE